MLTIKPTENENIHLAIVNDDDTVTEIGRLVLFRKKPNGDLLAGFEFPKDISIWRAGARKRKNHVGETVPLNLADDIKFKAKKIAVVHEIAVALEGSNHG